MLKGVRTLGKRQLDEIRMMRNPPNAVQQVFRSVHLLLNARKYPTRQQALRVGWDDAKTTLVRTDFIPRMLSFDASSLTERAHIPDLIMDEFLEMEGGGGGGEEGAAGATAVFKSKRLTTKTAPRSSTAAEDAACFCSVCSCLAR